MPYIALEGIDGCGKDTHADLLVQALTAAGRSPLRIWEPSKSAIGQLLRQSLKTGEFQQAHAALFVADRITQLANVVAPALAQGQDVVCSRSFLSSLVYQQEEWPFRWLLHLNWKLPVYPDTILLLDADPQVTLQRDTRATNPELYERLEILQRNRDRYLRYIKSNWIDQLTKHPNVGRVIPADGTVAATHALVCQALNLPPVVVT